MFNSPPPLPIRELGNDAPMQASKWFAIQVLMDVDEMQDLFTELKNFYIYPIGGIAKPGSEGISHQVFLECYKDYIHALKQGILPNESSYRPLFSSVITCDPNSLFAVKVAEDKHILRIDRPVIQQSIHKMDYSPEDQKFRSKVLGAESISWGIQYSYPQIFQNPIDNQIEQVVENDTFPNTQLFRRLQKWIRYNTVVTPINVESKKINIPMRLGKKCFDWINFHPQLVKKGMFVSSLQKE